MKLVNRLFRERTRATTRETVTFNAPGIYRPPYGKTVFELEGRGTSGNPSTGGNPAGANPGSGGNYGGVNPYYPGYVANYNPSTGGTYAGLNPATPGNYVGVNPATPGNVSGTNPPVPGNLANMLVNMHHNAYANSYEQWYWSGPIEVPGAVCPPHGPFYIPSQYGVFGPFYQQCSPGNYNPATPGNPNYNPNTPGNPRYNPSTPGNPRYNPTVPGNANYNPGYGGNPYYNPYYPGNTTYNPTVPGNAGAASNVLGVPLPGGAAGSAAPVVGYVPVSVEFSNQGITITVPPGGYIKIKNT